MYQNIYEWKTKISVTSHPDRVPVENDNSVVDVLTVDRVKVAGNGVFNVGKPFHKSCLRILLICQQKISITGTERFVSVSVDEGRDNQAKPSQLKDIILQRRGNQLCSVGSG